MVKASLLPAAGFLGTPEALPVLAAACAIPPLMGFWKNEYTVSFGYAGAMAISGGVALAAGGLSQLAVVHAGLVALYGLRLGVFLLWRQLSIQRFREFVEKIEARAPGNRAKRLPFIIGCAALYLGMVAPLVLTARYAATAPALAVAIAKVSLAAAAVGGVVEAVGDFQKSYFKGRQTEGEKELWVDQGLYAWLRHPNFTGEQLLWAGSFAAAVTLAADSLASAWPWVVGAAFGLVGIQFVLMGATTRLENRQEENYGGMPGFHEYRQKTWAGFTLKAAKAADQTEKMVAEGGASTEAATEGQGEGANIKAEGAKNST